MAGHGLQARGIARRNKMLKAATFLFLEQGYDKTTTTQIAKAAGMSQASFFAAFESKEAILLELTKIMFSSQFVAAAAMMPTDDPLLLYALETGLQLHITELSEPLRELYVATYSLPSTSEYVYQNTTEKLIKIFAPYLPEAQEKDFMSWKLPPPASPGALWRGPVICTLPWSENCAGISAAASGFIRCPRRCMPR